MERSRSFSPHNLYTTLLLKFFTCPFSKLAKTQGPPSNAPVMFISPMLLCLSFLISTTVQAKIDCRTYPSKVDVKLADCLAALNLIPDDGLAPGPPTDGVPSFLLPSSARSAPKRFRIPAYFWSDTCKISVVEPPLVIKIPKPTPTRAMPNPASVMYFKMWPEVREGAKAILDECFHPSRTGFTLGRTTVTVQVASAPTGVDRQLQIEISGHWAGQLDLSMPPPETVLRGNFVHYKADASGKVVQIGNPWASYRCPLP